MSRQGTRATHGGRSRPRRYVAQLRCAGWSRRRSLPTGTAGAHASVVAGAQAAELLGLRPWRCWHRWVISSAIAPLEPGACYAAVPAHWERRRPAPPSLQRRAEQAAAWPLPAAVATAAAAVPAAVLSEGISSNAGRTLRCRRARAGAVAWVRHPLNRRKPAQTGANRRGPRWLDFARPKCGALVRRRRPRAGRESMPAGYRRACDPCRRVRPRGARSDNRTISKR